MQSHCSVQHFASGQAGTKQPMNTPRAVSLHVGRRCDPNVGRNTTWWSAPGAFPGAQRRWIRGNPALAAGQKNGSESAWKSSDIAATQNGEKVSTFLTHLDSVCWTLLEE